MKLLQTISDNDLGGTATPDLWQTYGVRPSARAILFDSKSRIALMHVVGDNYYKLPGGGIDKGEEIEMALRRELREEVGASSVEILEDVGQIDIYLDKLKKKSEHVCFIAKLNGSIVETERTKEEIEQGYETVWVDTIDDAIHLVESGSPKKYGHDAERLRELTFLRTIKGQI